MRVAAGLLGALLLLAALPALVSDANYLFGRGAALGDAQVFTSFAALLSRLPPVLFEAEGLAAIAGSGAAASLLRLPAGPCLAALGLFLAILSVVTRHASGRSRQGRGAGEGPERPDAAHAPQATPALPPTRMDAVDREFLPAALELLETPPSPIRVAAIWLICTAFATALAWSYFGWLDIHAIAHGRIQPSGRSKIVQPLEPGKVIAIAVENGSRVAAGDVLVELDPTETDADREALTRELESTRAEAARRRVAVAAAANDGSGPPAIIFPEAWCRFCCKIRSVI
jgi:biotin/lipoyl-binding protein